MNQDTTQKPTYEKEIISETNEIAKLSEGTFPINYKPIQIYQLA